jgi:ATP-dependent RNA helicase DeaD
VAAALIRLHRQRLPEPEDVYDDVRDINRDVPAPNPRGAKAYDPMRERPAPSHTSDSVGAEWFRMPIGRQNNADPKWLIPLICRLGHVTKKDIGQIRIFDRETKFEIVAETEARFRQAIKGAAEGDIRIEPAAAPPAADRPRGSRPSGGREAPNPGGPKPAGPKPFVRPRGPAAREARPQGPRPPGKAGGGKPKRRSN